MLKRVMAAAGLAAILTAPAKAAEYVMSASADYSGPFADVMPSAMSGIQAVANWWNKEVGAKLGVKVDVKIHDMRYDAAVIARTWPSILTRDKPILHLGFGSPDLTTLMKRLPGDKVPMLIGTAMVGLVWQPNGWHFSIRPTYSHEFAGRFADLQQKKGSKLLIELNSQRDETPGKSVGWTTIRSLSDQTVRPVTKSARTSTSALSGATNILIQDICKGRTVSHIGTALDSVTFAAIQDAIDHPGPAKIKRLPRSQAFCANRYAPPFENAQGDILVGLANGVTGGNQTSTPRVSAEPAVDAWFRKIHR